MNLQSKPLSSAGIKVIQICDHILFIDLHCVTVVNTKIQLDPNSDSYRTTEKDGISFLGESGAWGFFLFVALKGAG